MIKKIITIILIILFLDFIYLNLTSTIYNKTIKNIQGSEIKLNLTGAILSYICVVILIYFFILPLVKSSKFNLLKSSIIYGGFMGFLVYGIYNFTNMAIFKNYNFSTALMDSLWGFTLFSIIVYVVSSIFK